jgi:hypothetical protein
VLIALAVAREVQADRLSWRAPPECPDATVVRSRIEAQLGRPLDERELADIRIAIEPRTGTLVAQIHLHPDDAEARELVAPSCDELVDAIALVVATAEAAYVPVEPRAPPPASPVASEPSRRVLAAWSIGVRAEVVVGGPLPGRELGGEVVAIITRGSIVAELGYARWLSGWVLNPTAGGNLPINYTSTELRVGWRGASTLPLAGWLAGELGSMVFYGRGANRLMAVGAGLGARWQLQRWFAAVITSELLVAVERPPQFVGYEPGKLFGQAALGFEATWR